MTLNKLKLAAAIGIGAVLAGSLPFVTLAQARKAARHAPRRPLLKARTTANMSALPAASKPTPPTVPKSLHVVYTILSKSEDYPPVAAEYWVAAPDSARWTWNGRYPTTIMTDGQTWMSLMEPPNAASVIKIDAATEKANPAPNQPLMSIVRAQSWNNATPSIYGPGVLAGEIPFLGFGQPGKIYRQGRVKVVKTANGWTEHCQIPQGYFRDSTTGKPALVDAILTYDRQGRLVRFRRNHAGDIWENTAFSGFIKKGGLEIPGQIRDWETDETGGRVVVDTETTYRIRSLDATPALPGWFSVQHPPQGTTIQDSRFSPPPKGAAGHSEDIYQYHGSDSVDVQSRARAEHKGR